MLLINAHFEKGILCFWIKNLKKSTGIKVILSKVTKLVSHLTPKSECVFLAFNEYLNLLRQYFADICHPHSTVTHFAITVYHLCNYLVIFPL